MSTRCQGEDVPDGRRARDNSGKTCRERGKTAASGREKTLEACWKGTSKGGYTLQYVNAGEKKKSTEAEL